MSLYNIKFNNIKWDTDLDPSIRTHLPRNFERKIEARDKWDAYVKTKTQLEQDYGINIVGAGGYSVSTIMPEAVGGKDMNIIEKPDTWSELESFLEDKLSPEEFVNLGSDQVETLRNMFPEALEGWTNSDLYEFLAALEGDEYENDQNDSMDGDAESALASAGFGTDEDYGGGGSYFDEAVEPSSDVGERKYAVLVRGIDWDIEGYERDPRVSRLPKASGRLVAARNDAEALERALERMSDDYGFLINGTKSQEIRKMTDKITSQDVSQQQEAHVPTVKYPSIREAFLGPRK